MSTVLWVAVRSCWLVAQCRFVIYKKDLESRIDITSPKELGGLRSEQYLALNPEGKMPILVLPDGTVIPECEVRPPLSFGAAALFKPLLMSVFTATAYLRAEVVHGVSGTHACVGTHVTEQAATDALHAEDQVWSMPDP